jgi:hypothetical protein
MIFWREKEKNCASRFEAKKAAMGDEARLVAPQLYWKGAIVALYYSDFFGK